VRTTKTNASEPLMTCRKRRDDAKTGGEVVNPGQAQGKPADCLGGVRHEGGVSVVWALVRNVGTCDSDAKGEIQVADPQG
jgi:hypothetical protein